MRAAGPFAVAVFLSALCAHCASAESPIGAESTALVADSDDVTGVESSTEQVGSAVSNSDTTVAPEPNVAQLAAACFQRERTMEGTFAGTDVYHLQGCGVAGVRGDVTMHWQLRALTVHVDMEAHNLIVGTSLLRNWRMTSDLVASGQERTMFWTSHHDGLFNTDKTPRAMSRDTQKTLHWTAGSGCITVDGTSTGTHETSRGMRSVRVSTIGFRHCGALCPEPSSRIRTENLLTNQAIEVNHTGASHALLTNVDGKLFSITPRCVEGK